MTYSTNQLNVATRLRGYEKTNFRTSNGVINELLSYKKTNTIISVVLTKVTVLIYEPILKSQQR